MDSRQNEVVFVKQWRSGFGTGSLGRVKCELREKTLTRLISRCDLLQLFQITNSPRINAARRVMSAPARRVKVSSRIRRGSAPLSTKCATLRLLEPESRKLVGAMGLAGPQANRPLMKLRWPLAGAFAAVWVGITGWQLAAAGVVTSIEAEIQTLWGLLPIVAATRYAYSIDRKLRRAEN